MRISEKTVELNICAQMVRASMHNLVWFGLTQAQEAKAGFDAATRLGGRLIIFQFKASNYTLRRTGAKRFIMEHTQLEVLCQQAALSRSVFYAFPLIGNTLDLWMEKGNFLKNTYLLDVSCLPMPYSKPTIRGSSVVLRKSNSHHGDVMLCPTPSITIHSKPQNFPLIKLSDLIEKNFLGIDEAEYTSSASPATAYQGLLELPSDLRRGMRGLIVF